MPDRRLARYDDQEAVDEEKVEECSCEGCTGDVEHEDPSELDKNLPDKPLCRDCILRNLPA